MALKQIRQANKKWRHEQKRKQRQQELRLSADREKTRIRKQQREAMQKRVHEKVE